MAVKSVTAFLNHLKKNRGASSNTIKAYEHDLTNYVDKLKEFGVKNPASASHANIQNYADYLHNCGKSNSSIVRSLSCIRNYYRFLTENGLISSNPADNIRYEEVKRKVPDFLSENELNALVSQPDKYSAKGIRDKAILEMLSCTGLQVNELINLTTSDINLSIKTVVIAKNEENERILPLNQTAYSAVKTYIDKVRPLHLAEETDALFINSGGLPLTRQGIWKIVSKYAEKSGINRNVSPQTIRNTFINRLLKNGVDINDVREIIGHIDLISTKAYAKLITERYSDIYSKLK